MVVANYYDIQNNLNLLFSQEKKINIEIEITKKTEKRYKEINELYAQFSLLIIKYDKDGNYKQALKEKAQELMLKIRPFAR